MKNCDKSSNFVVTLSPIYATLIRWSVLIVKNIAFWTAQSYRNSAAVKRHQLLIGLDNSYMKPRRILTARYIATCSCWASLRQVSVNDRLRALVQSWHLFYKQMHIMVIFVRRVGNAMYQSICKYFFTGMTFFIPRETKIFTSIRA